MTDPMVCYRLSFMYDLLHERRIESRDQTAFVTHSQAQKADNLVATRSSQSGHLFVTDSTHTTVSLHISTSNPCRSMGHGLDRTRSSKLHVEKLVATL